MNEEVVHRIPSKTRFLKEGDIVSLDAGVIYKGYHSDAARTYGVGKISPENEHLIAVTKQSFFEAMKVAVPGNHIRDIGRAVERYVLKFGYGIVEDLDMVLEQIFTRIRKYRILKQSKKDRS